MSGSFCFRSDSCLVGVGQGGRRRQGLPDNRRLSPPATGTHPAGSPVAQPCRGLGSWKWSVGTQTEGLLAQPSLNPGPQTQNSASLLPCPGSLRLAPLAHVPLEAREDLPGKPTSPHMRDDLVQPCPAPGNGVRELPPPAPSPPHPTKTHTAM